MNEARRYAPRGLGNLSRGNDVGLIEGLAAALGVKGDGIDDRGRALHGRTHRSRIADVRNAQLGRG
ncbi:MAG: hypothetical protein M5U09_13030 [Gammaproteobacteria bacterium]|nr:hypothetical protein [Gammaproteobacteria bacterium]